MKADRFIVRIGKAATTGFFCVFACSASAQNFPTRTITAIYPFAAGGASDVQLRSMFGEAAKTLGQSIVIENRPGAGGRLGVMAVQRATPDGHMIALATDSALTVVPNASPTFTAQPGRDYAPVHQTFGYSQVIVSQARLPFKDAKGWIEYAKANPGKLNYSSQGIGGSQHLYMEQILPILGIEMTHIPYGTAQQLTDIASGTIDMTVFTGGPLKPLVDAGKLNALAWSSPQRQRLFPNAPTLKELGYNLGLQGWVGIVTAPGTPPDVVAKLNAALNAAQKLPEVEKRFTDAGYELFFSTPQAFAAQIRADLDAFGPVVKRLGLKFE